MKTEQDVKLAIRNILSCTNSYHSSLNYAVGYCRAASGMTGNDLKVQCLYILNNITAWRDPLAQECRNTLKEFCGIKIVNHKRKEKVSV
jgi:hypothetical protein